MKTTGTIEAGTGLWYDPNTGATNSSGFTALPGGIRYDLGSFGEFRYISSEGIWWSSTEFNSTFAWGRFLFYIDANAFRSYYGKAFGFSVRCVRD